MASDREEKNKLRAQLDRPTVLRMRALEWRIVRDNNKHSNAERVQMVEELGILRGKFDHDNHEVVNRLLGPDSEPHFLRLRMYTVENSHLNWLKAPPESRVKSSPYVARLDEVYAENGKFFSIDDPDSILDRIDDACFEYKLEKEIASEAALIISAAARACGVEHLVQIKPVEAAAMASGFIWDGLLRELEVSGAKVDKKLTSRLIWTKHIARLESLPPVDGASEILKSATRLGRAAYLRTLKKLLEDD